MAKEIALQNHPLLNIIRPFRKYSSHIDRDMYYYLFAGEKIVMGTKYLEFIPCSDPPTQEEKELYEMLGYTWEV